MIQEMILEGENNTNSIDVEAEIKQGMKKIREFNRLLDEFQGKSEINKTLEGQNIKNSYISYFFQEKLQIRNESLDFFNQKFIFLIGNSRVGKSTIFHLLKGDELEEKDDDNFDVKEGKQTLIGHEGQSYTKSFNIFHNPEKQFIIVDTPGLNDTKEGLKEVVSQFCLIKAMNKCQNILILVVSKFDQSNDDYLQETMKQVYNLFENYDHFKLNEKNIRLIITKGQKKNMQDKMKKIFDNILESNPSFQLNGLLQLFKANLHQILFFQDRDSSEKQLDLRNEIIEFIVNSPCQAQSNFSYQLTMSVRGPSEVRTLLSNIQNFFSFKLENQINQLILEVETRFKTTQFTSKFIFFGIFLRNSISKLNGQDYIQAKMNVYQKLLNIANERLLLKQVHTLIKVIIDITKEYNLDRCLDNEIIEAKTLFEKKLIGPMLDLDNKNEKFQLREVKIEKAFYNLNQKALATTNELIYLYQAESLVKQVQIDSIVKSLDEFKKQTQKNWNKTVIVIGSRLSGKSKFINLIYKGKDESLENKFIMQENHIIELRRQNGLDYKTLLDTSDENYIQTKNIGEDIVIEFEDFCDKLIPLAQYFLSQSCQFNKPFIFVLVLNNIEKNQNNNSKNYLIQAAANFFKSNFQIQSWNFRVIFNNQDDFQIKCAIPNEIFDQYLQSQIKFCYIEKGIIDNPKILEESLITISNFEKKKKYPYCELFQYIIDCALLQLQKSFLENKDIWQYSGKDQEILSLIQLSKLTVKSSNFKYYLRLLCQKYQVEQPIGDNYEILFEFHKKLIFEQKVIDKLLKAKNDAVDVKKKLENLCQNCHQYYSHDLLNDFLALENLISIFPIYFEQENKTLKNLLQVITVVVRAIYDQERCFEFDLNSWSVKLKICSHATHYNPILNLIWNLLQMVNQDIKSQQYLLDLMKETQTSYFKYGGYFMYKLYYRVFSNSEQKVQENQRKVKKAQQELKSIKLIENYEDLANKQSWLINN